MHLKLNLCLNLIVDKYRTGNVKRTLRRRLQVPEAAAMKLNGRLMRCVIAAPHCLRAALPKDVLCKLGL